MIDAPGTFPIKTPKTAAGKSAVKLHAEFDRQYGRVDQVEKARRAAVASHAQAEKELADALFEDERAGGAKSKRTQDCEAALAVAVKEVSEPWTERMEAASRAASTARDELGNHVSANLDELLTEPELQAAADQAGPDVIDAVDALYRALDTWGEVADRHKKLLAMSDAISGRAIPRLGAKANELRKVANELLMAIDRDPRKALPRPVPDKRALEDRRQLLDTGETRFVGK